MEKLGLTFLLICSICIQQCSATQRVYYIAAVDVQWDYAPSGMNAKNGIALDSDPDASVFTKKSATRIGKVYKKTVYREYTNGTFTQQKPRDKNLGILGPVIKGEEGDHIKIYFKNMAKRNFSMHPHGVFYQKSSEGAKYLDNTAGSAKKDDDVLPGTTHVYDWQVKPENAPEQGDDNCIPWVYHSHISPVNDINTGTVGILLTCRKGSLNANGNRKDVDKEIIILASIFDENKSWYLDDNLRQNKINVTTFNKEDDDFKESNLLHGLNGLFYGNLPGLDVCVGDKVAWYVANLGNEVDMHTAIFNGNTIISDHHRADTMSVFPAKSVVATMDVQNPGDWMFSCQVADHFSGGMFTLYHAKQCGKKSTAKPKLDGKLREYFIAAEEVEWDYGPTGMNLFSGGFLANGSASAKYFKRTTNRIGGKYIKAVYVEYTDATFSTKRNQTASEKHRGIIGPAIRGEVGDTIRVTFKNKASRKYSIHPRGVFYDKKNEGALYNDNTNSTLKNDDGVLPNSTYVYNWTIPESVAPSKLDFPCIAWMYTSSTDQVADIYSGLIGPLIVCKKGSLEASGLPKGYDEQRFLLMGIMDENKSWYLDRNMKYCTASSCGGISKENEDFMESNKMSQINGYMYGNLKGLEFCKGKKILWHSLAVGTEVDMHSIFFYGNNLKTTDGNHRDGLVLFPGEAKTFEMVPENIGQFGLVDRVNGHFTSGTISKYEVKNCSSGSMHKVKKVKKTYYIAAVEVEWDYAESNRSLTHGFTLDNHESSKVFTKRGPTRIGKVYKKAVYREYTDASFKQRMPVTNEMKHLGMLGPIIRAEEGDEIAVVFKNMATRGYSINPRGAFYSKENEGSIYTDNSSLSKSGTVPPGAVETFYWRIPSQSAPGSTDGPCATWAYYSATDMIKDTNAGLIGPLITCKKGTLDSKNMRKDVDKEFALLFTVMDENQSWYLDDNIKTYALTPNSVSKSDDGFKESNKMHAINGYIYGNGPRNGGQYLMKANEKVAWYLMGIGDEVDIHTVHFHANNFVQRTNAKHNHDVFNVFPGVFETLEMTPKNPGTWLLHCHVHDHLEGGMETRYTVLSQAPDPGTKKPVTTVPGAAGSNSPSVLPLLTTLMCFLLFLRW